MRQGVWSLRPPGSVTVNTPSPICSHSRSSPSSAERTTSIAAWRSPIQHREVALPGAGRPSIDVEGPLSGALPREATRVLGRGVAEAVAVGRSGGQSLDGPGVVLGIVSLDEEPGALVADDGGEPA